MQAVLTDDMAALSARFPGWHIWRTRSAGGRETDWNATRKGRPPAAPGSLARLSAGRAASLWSLLEQQETLTGRAAA